jgi:hypothetical protein
MGWIDNSLISTVVLPHLQTELIFPTSISQDQFRGLTNDGFNFLTDNFHKKEIALVTSDHFTE